eukprot:Em0021g443a
MHTDPLFGIYGLRIPERQGTSTSDVQEFDDTSSRNSVKFFGQIVDQNGIKPDPEKVNAIACMAELTNVSEIRRFLGMVNQHSKFSPKLAELTKPLWYLLSKKNQWMWGQKQKDAFDQVKKELIVLYFYRNIVKSGNQLHCFQSTDRDRTARLLGYQTS